MHTIWVLTYEPRVGNGGVLLVTDDLAQIVERYHEVLPAARERDGDLQVQEGPLGGLLRAIVGPFDVSEYPTIEAYLAAEHPSRPRLWLTA